MFAYALVTMTDNVRLMSYIQSKDFINKNMLIVHSQHLIYYLAYSWTSIAIFYLSAGEGLFYYATAHVKYNFSFLVIFYHNIYFKSQ